jgi:hypothetical protein
MGLTATAFPTQRKEFGIHSITAVNRTTKLPYGTAEILGDAVVNFAANSVDLIGGSSYYPWATEITDINSEVQMNLKTFPDWVEEVYMGASVTTTAASAISGTISALSNEKGTSVFDATTGVATATLKSSGEGDLKTSHYLVEAASATTVNVYAVSSLQFARGTDLYYESDNLDITATALTIATASAVEIPGTGVELTGGSGTIAMVTGDVALFTVAPPHNGISDIDIGQKGIIFPEHELYIFGKERASGEKALIRCYKAQGVSGMSYPFSQSDFAQSDLTVKLLYDEAVNKVASFRFITGP